MESNDLTVLVAQLISSNQQFLSGIAQNTYQDVATDPMITYTALKGEIMKRYG